MRETNKARDILVLVYTKAEADSESRVNRMLPGDLVL